MQIDPRLLQALCGLFLVAATSTASLAQETFGVLDDRPIQDAKPEFVPFSSRVGVDLDGVTPEVALAPIDLERALREDSEAAELGMKSLRYGVGRDLYADAKWGAWTPLEDGSALWSLDVVSMRALGVRLHFSKMELPRGATLVVYSVKSETSAKGLTGIIAGPFEDSGLLGTGEFWTPTRDGERIRVELHVPADQVAGAQSDNLFEIDQVQHIYRDPAKGTGGAAGAAGPCHNDVTCSPAWSNVAQSVAGVGSIVGDSVFCTGQLIDTQAGDMTPYFLTANHCGIDTGAAPSTEIYWRYQTSTCNGSVPSLGSVPQSAVTTHLSSSAASDYTLLMIEGTLPAGLFWSGWSSSTVSNGTASTAVHHPSGEFKRISFGSKGAGSGCGGSGHVRVNWSNGPTEPGSSGSGIFRNDTQQLYGQLHCGPSACGNESNDDYGSFSTTYPNISGLLAAGSDDSFEPNDSCAAAASLSAGTENNLIVKGVSEDWYRVTISGGGSFTADLDFTHAFGDIDVQLLSACGGTVVASATSGSNDEALAFTNTGATADFFLRVWLFSDTRNEYSLTTAGTTGGGPCSGPDDGFEENDSCAAATSLSAGGQTGLYVRKDDIDDDWYSIAVPAGATLAVDVLFSNAGGDVDARLFDACGGTQVDISQTTDDDEFVTVTNNTGSTINYKLEVYVWAGGIDDCNEDYDLSVVITGGDPCAVPDDGFEPNDLCVVATVLSPGGHINLFVRKDNVDEDWYRITVPAGGTLTADVLFTDADGDIDARLFDACGGTQVDLSQTTDDNEQVSVMNASASAVDYFLEVYVWANAADDCNNYDLGIDVQGGPPVALQPYCFGDGSGTGCPCGNNSTAGHPGGCAHQDGNGGILTGTGVPSVSNDTLHFDLTSAASTSFGMLVSGDNQLPLAGCVGCGIVAFDGLRCAGGNFLRHGSRAINGSGNANNGWGVPAGPPGGLAAAIGAVAGQTKNFFVFFRTDLAQTCGMGQNSSNGVSVLFSN